MKIRFLMVAFLCSAFAVAQPSMEEMPPKLVVGIIVDQMRQEYLYRFYPKFGEGGFKRLMNDGFMVRNGHYNYAPTVTGPGHASVYTGSTPAIHGIIGNSWYDKELKKEVNCVNDPRFAPVGVKEGNGTVSPWRLNVTTITDELKLATQKRAKVIGMSVKDRGAVLPAGHMADGAYWYDGKTGRFITSTYYREKLPDWVERFNARNLPEKYLSQEWKTVYPIEQYVESGPDDTPYEVRIGGKDKPVFPYDLKALRKPNDYGLLSTTPFSNEHLVEFAKAAVDGEQMGKDDITDFLTISFSATDGLGHGVGPNAVEIQDMYIRLDRSLADLFKTLDSKVGQGNYTVFLSADHAVADNAQFSIDNRLPGGLIDGGAIAKGLKEHLANYFPDRDIIEAFSGGQVYFNQQAFENDPKASGVELLIATELTVNYLMNQPGIAQVYSENVLRQSQYSEGGPKGMVTRGYHAKRGGDVVIVPESGWYMSTSKTGTTHGSPWTYDTHVPILFYGKGIRKGTSAKYQSITDIAPTIAVLLNIKFPSGCTGQPVVDALKD